LTRSYEESIKLAKERGSFPIFDVEKEQDHPFISRIISELVPPVQEDYKKYGRRNIANTTTAPAGSVSCLTQTTSGIEPAFMLYYKRRKKVQNDEEVMFVDELGDEWTEFLVYHHAFKQWLDSQTGRAWVAPEQTPVSCTKVDLSCNLKHNQSSI
jgi:ribonucleoside-diphosphate reductase alpha chain